MAERYDMSRFSPDTLSLNPQLKDMLEQEEKKERKYHNQPVTVDGIRFDSGKEAARANELMMLYRAGEIIAITFHKRLPIHPEGSKPIYYECDFCYVTKDLKVVVEDTKGVRTPTYKLKKKLFEAKYGIKITES